MYFKYIYLQEEAFDGKNMPFNIMSSKLFERTFILIRHVHICNGHVNNIKVD